MVGKMVAGDGENPGGFGAAFVVSIEVLQGLDEDLTREVLRERPVRSHAKEDEAVDLRKMGLVKTPEIGFAHVTRSAYPYTDRGGGLRRINEKPLEWGHCSYLSGAVKRMCHPSTTADGGAGELRMTLSSVFSVGPNDKHGGDGHNDPQKPAGVAGENPAGLGKEVI